MFSTYLLTHTWSAVSTNRHLEKALWVPMRSVCAVNYAGLHQTHSTNF